MAPTKQRRRGHDRGQVLVDLAVAIADGATTISDLRVLCRPTASSARWPRCRRRGGPSRPSTHAASNASPRPGPRLGRVAWAAGMDPGFYVIDLDATLVDAHSEKEGAAPNYKHGFGFYPLVAFLDATGEPLAAMLRPGNAGPGTADDHVIVLDARLGPAAARSRRARGDRPDRLGRLLARLHEACADARCALHRRPPAQRRAGPAVVTTVPKNRWKKAISADGTEERDVRRGRRDHRPGGSVALAGGHPDDRPA